MLPDDFEWRPYIDGPALYLGDRMLAVSTRLERSWRTDFVLHRRSEFFASEEAATRYVIAWACKWEDRIRREARPPVRGWGPIRKP